MRTARRHVAATVYQVAVGFLGWGLLVVLWIGIPLSASFYPLVLFSLLSACIKRLGFQVSRHVTHSLVGVVDMAALFTLGIPGGGIVAVVSGTLCQLLCRPEPSGDNAPQVWLRTFFGGGLNVWMMFAAGRLYTALAGQVPMTEISWITIPAVLVACVTWFVLDHMGWGVAELLAYGTGGLKSFIQDILPYSLLVELLPLPASMLLSTAYLSSNAPLLLVMVFAIVAVGWVLRQLIISLHKERERTAQLMTIAQVSRKVAAILDLQTLFADTVRLVQEAFGYYHVSIFAVNSERQEILFQASSNTLIQQRGTRIPWGQGIIGHAALTGQNLLVGDVLHDTRFLPDSALEETRAELAVPLKVGKRIVGILDVQNNTTNALGEKDVFVLEALADQIAIAIEDSRLYQAQQEQAWVSTALLQVADAVAQLRTPEEILETVVRLTPLLTGVDRCLIFLWSEEDEAFTAVGSIGFTRDQVTTLQQQHWGAQAIPLLARVRAEQQGIYGRSEELLAFLPSPLSSDVRRGQLLALPLLAQGEVIGVLVAEDFDQDRHLATHHRTILTEIANHAAMALENARLYAAQREEAWVSTALLQVANMISVASGLDETISAVVRAVPMLMGGPWCAILLWDEARQVFSGMHAYGLPRAGMALLEREYTSPQDLPLLQCLTTNTAPINAASDDEEGLLPSEMAHACEISSLTALPLRVHDKLVGALLVGHTAGNKPTQGRRLNILLGIANQTALAIEAAQLYQRTLQQERLEREIELARNIQESFMPECCPDVPGWELSVEWRAARGVGGDFYDYIQLDAQHLGLVIADVSDKGVAAALYMALSRTVMRTAAIGTQGPAETLRRANQILMQDSRSGMFVSMFYGILDLQRGTLVYARAGHNPPFWLRAADHHIMPLSAPGIVLGVVDDPQFVEESVDFGPGDVLIMYTDGVTEAMNDQEQEFGETRLQQVLSDTPQSTANALVDAIVAAVRAFTGEQPQFDDFTLLACRREPAGSA
jgi:phosphoserine phosphatase RsbU/P